MTAGEVVVPAVASAEYEAAGVALDAMDGLKDRIKAFAAMTHGPEVLDGSGGFAGLFALGEYRDPVLVASADGVGTKLKIASQLGHFEGVGQDLVTLNVNDILTKGARPLFFLDYMSFSALDEHRMEMLMRGMVWGCREAGCALIGGRLPNSPAFTPTPISISPDSWWASPSGTACSTAAVSCPVTASSAFPPAACTPTGFR